MDLRGRKEADRRGIHAIGTLGVLRIAAKRRLLNLNDALISLRATNFYIDQELFDRLVAEAEQSGANPRTVPITLLSEIC